MTLEDMKGLENQKKQSDYLVSKRLMDTLQSSWEEAINWEEGKKYPNRFAYDLIASWNREVVLDHINNFNKTEQLAVRLINIAYEEDEWKIWIILGGFSWLSKKLALSLISSKYQCEDEVIFNSHSFKWLDYEVAYRLAMKGVLHDKFWVLNISKDDFVWINEDQWQELIKLSKDRYISNKKFKRELEEERKRERDNLERDNRE